MKKNLFKRGMAGLLSLVMCLTALVGIGTTTAYAAGERAEVYLVSFPRSGDANIDWYKISIAPEADRKPRRLCLFLL